MYGALKINTTTNNDYSQMSNPIRLISNIILTVIFGLFIIQLSAQTDSISNLRKNAVKVNLISLPPLLNNLNQKWIGLEYQRVLNAKVSLSMIFDVGVFEDYTYTKYYDFFDEGLGFHYIQEDVKITGFHLIPTARYNITQPISNNFRVYFTTSIDYYQYTKREKVFESYSNNQVVFHNSTYRLNMGAGTGLQYIAFSRLVVELNVSLFTKLFSKSTNNELPELYPENAFWRNSNNSTWATINLMLGYAFGNNVKKKNKLKD